MVLIVVVPQFHSLKLKLTRIDLQENGQNKRPVPTLHIYVNARTALRFMKWYREWYSGAPVSFVVRVCAFEPADHQLFSHSLGPSARTFSRRPFLLFSIRRGTKNMVLNSVYGGRLSF